MEENTVKPKKKSKKNWYILMLILGVVLLIVLIVWLLMKGDMKTTGNYPDDITPESLKCVKKNVAYKIFTHDDPTVAEVRINAVFTKGKLDSISLVHRTAYRDEEVARTRSDSHEGDMNFSFTDSGMKQFALNATYTLDENVAQMSLYARADEVDSASIKYFMLDNLPENLTGYKRGYTSQGFTCEVIR